MNTAHELHEALEALRRGHHRKAGEALARAVDAFQAFERRAEEREQLARREVRAEHERTDPWKEQSLALAAVELARDPLLINAPGGEVVQLARDVLNAILLPEVIEAATRKAPERMAELFVIQMDPSA